jgi:antitoxin VapB
MRKNSSRYSSSVALNIKDADTDRLARELAELTGQPITVAVREAIEERLDRLRRRKALTATPELADIIDRGRRRQLLDERTDDEILGYGDDGIPT